MQKHYGQIVEYLVRKNGFSITELGQELNVNRRTIYNWFQNKYLKQDIIFRVGVVIRHDFSLEFPELFKPEEFVMPSRTIIPQNQRDVYKVFDDEQWKDKYLTLLEKYSDLLSKRISAPENE